MLNRSRIVYFWVAEYKNGRALPQFDLETGRENLNVFHLSDVPTLKGFGWYPFSKDFANKVQNALKTQQHVEVDVHPSNLPFQRINLNDGDKLVAKKEITITVYDFHVCLKCGCSWQFSNKSLNPKIQLPVSNVAFRETFRQHTERGEQTIVMVSPTCPSCGYHDTNAVMKADKQVLALRDEIVETIYVLGKFGGQIKHIHEDGSVD
jgi:hypothetical protein